MYIPSNINEHNVLNHIENTSAVNGTIILYIEVGGGRREERSFEMSLCTLPILYLNLGGEMLYIIRHRLQAQDVHPEKAHRGTWQADYL